MLLGTGVSAAAPPALNEGVRIDQLQPASPESAFFRAEGPHDPAAEGVEFAAGATFEYAKGLLKEVGVDKAGGRQTIAKLVDHAILARVSGSITPVHWLSFDLSLPFALFEAGDAPLPYVTQKPSAAKAPGVGDLRLGVHFRPVDTKAFGLILGGRFWAPFGSQDAYLSDRRFRGEVDIGVAGEASRVLYGCTFNVAPTFFAQRNGDRLAGACAVHVTLGPVVSLGVEPSFQLVTHTNLFPLDPTKPDGKPSLGVLVEPLGALRLRFGGFRLGFAAGPGFGGGMGSAEVRGLVSFAYVGLGKPPKPPPVGPSNRDLDKIPDTEDACPDEAGPSSRDPKANGCPARDRDGDGIRDDEDFCPDRPGIPYPDPKANGCPDSDNDGLPDPIDACVNEPGAAPRGCPKHAHLASGAFKIEPAIDFGIGDKLTSAGRTALEEVAATMRANPKIEQISISVGTKGARPALSDKRAQEILLVLRAANLDPARYEVVLRDDLRAGVVQVRIVK
ncbi:MAG: hypothetical protein QM820_05260 [Minicystis sp.]